METYCCTFDTVIIVPIHNILINKQIAKSLKELFCVNNFSKVIEKTGGSFLSSPSVNEAFPLARIDSVLYAIKNGTSLPPIDVHEISFNGKSYYDIIDGRHRFTVSVFVGYNWIPIRVCK